MISSKRMKQFVSLVTTMTVFAMLFLVIIPGDSDANTYSNTVGKDDHIRYYLSGGERNDTYEISFEVLNDGNADVYIMSEFEYNNHYNKSKDFNASFSEENTNYFKNEKWTQPDNQDYYLIVDNLDNEHSNDAVPTGDVTYEVEEVNKTTEEEVEEFIDAVGKFFMICCVGIIVVIVVILYLVFRKKKNPPIQSYPMSQPGQYNQPPGQYNQPPPGQYNPPPGQYNQPPPGQYNQPPPGQYNPPPGQYNPPPQRPPQYNQQGRQGGYPPNQSPPPQKPKESSNEQRSNYYGSPDKSDQGANNSYNTYEDEDDDDEEQNLRKSDEQDYNYD